MAEQRFNAETLRRIIFHDEKFLSPGSGVFADARDCGCESVCRSRLSNERERAMRQSMMPVLIKSKHLDGNVARRRILLQVIQDRPAKHIGQTYIERYG